MPAKYRFETNEDSVDFFDDAMIVRTFPTEYQGFGWFYDASPGIRFSFEGNQYQTDDLADISFDDVPLASKGGFKTALGGMFPFYASAEGSIEGIERVGDDLIYTAVLHNFQGDAHVNGNFIAGNGISTQDATNVWNLGGATTQEPDTADTKITVLINGTTYWIYAKLADD